MTPQLTVSRSFLVTQSVLDAVHGTYPTSIGMAGGLRNFLREYTLDGRIVPVALRLFVREEYRTLSKRYREAS